MSNHFTLIYFIEYPYNLTREPRHSFLFTDKQILSFSNTGCVNNTDTQLGPPDSHPDTSIPCHPVSGDSHFLTLMGPMPQN